MERLGMLAATLMSWGARGLGYFLFGLLKIIYRGDPKMIALYGGTVAVLVGIAHLIAWLT